MSDLNLPKLFNHELNSIYQSKPPVSRAKMASITKQALNAVKYYKHVVIAVEKFIAKCRPEYKLPGLYVIDSIVRQSQYQHGNKDVYGPRFSKNFQTTFENLFQCREEDKPKIVRVLNLWQKNDIYAPDVIQPLMKLASQNRGSLGGDSGSSASLFNHSQSSALEAAKKPVSQSFQSSGTGSAASKGTPDLKGNSDAALIIQQQQQKIDELMQQQQQLLQAQALQSLLGQNPVLAAAAAAVAVKDKADNSIVSLLQEQQNQLNQLETLKNQLQFEPSASEPVAPKPYKESTTMSGHPTEFNKALLDDFDYSDDEEDMTQRIQRQRKQVEEQQTRLQDSSSIPDMDMLAQLQEQFRRNEHKHILTGGVGSTDAGRMHEDANVNNDPGFHAVSSLPSMMQMPPPHHQQPPPSSMPHHHHHHEPPPSHLPPQGSLSPEPFPPLPPHRRNQPPLPPHFEDNFPPPPQQLHDNVYPMPPPPPSHRGGNGFHDNHHSPPPPRFNDEPFFHGNHRFPPRERRRSRSPVPPPGGRSRSPLPPLPRGRSRSPLPPPGGRSRSPLPPPSRRSRSPPHGRSRSPHPPGGRSRRWDRDSRGRRSRSRSPPPVAMQPQQQVRGYPHNTWEPTRPDMEPPSQPPPPPKVEWRGKEIPSPKPKHYSVCSTTIWVGRLPKGITKLQLREAFKEFGPIHSVEMVVQRGCAYVCMVYRADTVRARNGLMNAKIGGTYCKLAWAPGKGVKGSDYKSYWSLEDGASFIPWDLVKEGDLEELAVGGVIDPETYPPGVKPLPPPKSKEETTAPLPPQDKDHTIPAPPTTSIAAPPPPMAPQMIPSMPPPPIPPPQQAQTFQPPMHMPLPPGNMMPPGGPFGAGPPPAHMQGPPPPMGGPPPNMRPPFSQPGPPPQFSAPMVSPTFGGGHQMEMQFGAPQINMQQMPPPGGHQMEMLRQPPPTSIPPPQVNPNQFLSAAASQNLPPDMPGERQMESQQQEQTGEKSDHQEDTVTKPVEPSAAENDDSDKMDICDTWEQEKVQRLAEEVEKFEQEVMNIERNNMKTATDTTAAEISSTTEAERTVDTNMVTEITEKESVDEVKKIDAELSGDSEAVREVKEDLSHITDGEVKTVSQEESTEELSKVEPNRRETGEGEDSEVKQSTTELTEVADNPVTSDQNATPAEDTNVEQEIKQNKKVDEKPSIAAETNEATSFDDAMDLQESSPEPFDEPAPQLTTDNA